MGTDILHVPCAVSIVILLSAYQQLGFTICIPSTVMILVMLAGVVMNITMKIVV